MRITGTRFQFSLVAIALVLTVVPGAIGIATKPQGPDAAIYYEQGQALFKAEKFKEAVNAFKQAIKLKPDYVDAYYRLGETYYELGEFDKVVDTYKQAVRCQPDSALAYEKLGEAYSDKGDYQKAGEAYNEAIRLNPKAPDLHYRLGVTYYQRDKKKEAIAEYNVLQTLDPNLAQDLYNLIYKPVLSVVSDGAVRLKALAIDSQGNPVSGLTTEDFQVVEEGTPQLISVSTKSDAPVFFGVAIDSSGSVRPIFNLVVASAKAIIEKAQPQDKTLLVRFISSDKIETLQEFTSDRKKLTNAIDTLYVEGGQSAIVDAVYLSAQSVGGHKFPDSSVRRILILLTDGDERASYYSTAQLSALLRAIDLQIFPISVMLNQNQPKRSADLLKLLASESGGKAFFPKSVAELKTAIDQIFALVRAEYTIQYKPTNPIKEGVYRTVGVSLLPKPGRENWTVTTRSGYVFAK